MKSPRRNLSFTFNRRQLLPALLQELFVIAGSFNGRQGCQLSDLGGLSDEQLARMRPILHPDYEIFVDQGYLHSRTKKTKASWKLCPLEQENLLVLNLFNGEHDLGQIGSQLAQTMGWEEAIGFAYARELFLLLVSRQVCIPRDPPIRDA